MRRALLIVLFLALSAPATAGATIPLAAHPSAPRYGSQVTLSGTAAPGDVVELFYNSTSTGQTADADLTTGDFGFALGWVRLRSGSVWPGVLAHGFFNAVGILVVYLQLAY